MKKLVSPNRLVKKFSETQNKVNFFEKLNSYLLVLNKFLGDKKYIQKFLNEIQTDLHFNLQKDGDWKNIKILIPDVEGYVSVEKIILNGEGWKRWDLGTEENIPGAKTVWFVTEKEIERICSHYIKKYKKIYFLSFLFI